MASPSFDVKLIPEYDGTDDVVDWLEKLEMVCELQTPSADQLIVVPLRLKGGASAVYRQLPAEVRKDLSQVKLALRRAFAADKFIAYEEFVHRQLQDNESVDVYAAHLKHISSLFGGLTEEGMTCAFVSGLPDTVKQILRAGARMGELSLNQVVDRARAILCEEGARPAVSAGVKQYWHNKCISCRNENTSHKMRQQSYKGSGDKRGENRTIRCFCCNGVGHIAAQCPSKRVSGNEKREERHAPASSRD